MSRTVPANRRLVFRWALLALVLIALTSIGVGVVGFLSSATQAQTATLKDMAGNPITLDEGTSNGHPSAASRGTDTATRLRFTVPSVHLDVPLRAMTETGHTITPPGFQAAYLVTNHGVDPDHATTGTMLIAMHSVRGGGIGPGNYLMNVNTGKATVAPGVSIHVGSLTYTVTGSQTVRKTDIGSVTTIWQNTPGQLVILTCLQTPAQTESVDNLIITATLSTPNGHQ